MFDAVHADPSPALQQSREYAQTLELLGQSPKRLADGTLTLHRRWCGIPLTMLPRARMPDPETTLACLASVGVRGPVIFSPDHPSDLSEIGALPLVSPATVARLDLTPPPDALEAHLHQKWRNRLRHARAQGLRVTRQNMPDDPNHWLFQADSAQRKQRRYHTWPTSLTLAWMRANRSGAKLFTAFDGRDAVAALLILRHGTGAAYHMGHTTEPGRRSSAHTLLLWYAMMWLHGKGVTSLDLGTIDTEDTPGLTRFKLGTGAEPQRLGGTWLCWPPLTTRLGPLARMDRTLMQGLWTAR
ncbi:GNAT family N-acetyltransferase [uncultured Roseobacter sp.]|uniref:GNAT family N-acetyltransferase n=1 Tax=uncultured Roseobacter sp. TaxID=114847 RepID=UPI002627C400|nr:GNAT family N-acetyltransferase [uncultured Roseobacter sp.]